MEALLYAAAILLIAISFVHSILGEKYILIPLFNKDDLPMLFGGTEFTKNTLRFAWHLTSVAWIGFSVVLMTLVDPAVNPNSVGKIIGYTFLVHFLIAFLGSKGKHWSWLVFLAIGVLTLVASNS